MVTAVARVQKGSHRGCVSVRHFHTLTTRLKERKHRSTSTMQGWHTIVAVLVECAYIFLQPCIHQDAEIDLHRDMFNNTFDILLLVPLLLTRLGGIPHFMTIPMYSSSPSTGVSAMSANQSEGMHEPVERVDGNPLDQKDGILIIPITYIYRMDLCRTQIGT
jgi:hypothetical protein